MRAGANIQFLFVVTGEAVLVRWYGVGKTSRRKTI